ncbi:MAG: hypothetical protein C0432_02055 [Candidatus Puniceispirillum sp.]|nr:hypothetical protein [Candidatus Pelagibacter sp.]MBA4283058.1 hypothetical protein [Candidatus Puniceispirillum sp.]
MKLVIVFFALITFHWNSACSDSSKEVDIAPQSDMKITGDIIEYDPNKNVSIVHSGSIDAKVSWNSRTHKNLICTKKIIVAHQNKEVDQSKKITQINTIILEGPVYITLEPLQDSDKTISIHAKKCVYQNNIIDCTGHVEIMIDKNKIQGDCVHFNFNTLLFEVKSNQSGFAEAHFVIPQKNS